MFKYSLLVMLFVPIVSSATKWVALEAQDPSHLIDMDSIQKKENLMRYRTKVNALNEYYSINYFEQNCQEGSERIYKEERYANIGDKLLTTTTYHSKKFLKNPSTDRNRVVCSLK